ncbi:MAG: U32 family peptidase, partial [Clostridia bacterium]|nr:U32 family peptidase [Clostridia bacterium]
MELLAPCGTIESLRLAVAAGADAVYLGLGILNARAKSTDFSIDNLPEHVRYCHLYGVKVYVTVNVEIWQDELDTMRALLDGIARAGADAVIACDMAVIQYALHIGLPVHVSTQAGVHTVEGAKFYQEMGVKRVVLSREYDLKEAKAIADLGLEVEVFVHGALCVSFSGGCLLSSYIGGESGNRGRCKQPCRQLYTAYDQAGRKLDEGYLISPKDLAFDRELANLQAAGVTSLKIEGRLKRSEYVSVVTRYYRALLDGKQTDREQVKLVYNRGGFSSGYFAKEPIIYKQDPTHIGVEIGRIVKTVERGGYPYAWIESASPIAKGDGLKIMRDGLVVGGADVTSVTREGDRYLVPVSRGVQVGDIVRMTTSAEQVKEALAIARKIPCDLTLTMQPGEPATLTACRVTVTGDVPQEGREMTREELTAQLSRTGNTPFEPSSIDVDYRGGYLPKSALNALRNKALEALADELSNRVPKRLEPKELTWPEPAQTQYSRVVEIDSPQDVVAEAVVFNPINLDCKTLDAMLARIKVPAFVKIPRVMVGAFDEAVEWAKERGVGLYADNISTVWTARELGLPYIAGIGLNITNDMAARAFADARMIVASPETKPPLGTVVYGGALPLMTWAHCPWQTVTGKTCAECTHKGQPLRLESKGSKFWVKPTVGKRCVYTMYAQ